MVGHIYKIYIKYRPIYIYIHIDRFNVYAYLFICMSCPVIILYSMATAMERIKDIRNVMDTRKVC